MTETSLKNNYSEHMQIKLINQKAKSQWLLKRGRKQAKKVYKVYKNVNNRNGEYIPEKYEIKESQL